MLKRLFFLFIVALITSSCSKFNSKQANAQELVKVYDNADRKTQIKTFQNAFLAKHGKENIGLELNFSYIEEKDPEFFIHLQFHTDKLSPRVSKGDRLVLILDKKENLNLKCSQSKTLFREQMKSNGSINPIAPQQNFFTALGNKTPSISSQKSFSPSVGLLATFEIEIKDLNKILAAKHVSLQFQDHLSQTPLTGSLHKRNLDILKEFKNQLEKKNLI
jgi:hypothetical protein